MKVFALPTRRCLPLGALAVATAAPAVAQDYPTRPVRLFVGYSAGGGMDAVARLIAPALGAQLGQQVVVENRPGAAGLLAAGAMARSPADGYALLLGESGLLIAQHLQPRAGFDPLKDFAPIGGLFNLPLMIVSRPDFAASSPRTLIDELKAHPGKYAYATSGVGTVHHLGMEMLKGRSGAFVLHIPYRGASQIVPDIIGGQVPLGVVSAAVAGLVSFAVALTFLVIYLRRKRHPLAPDAALRRALWIDPALLKGVLRIGVPTGVQMVTISLAELAILGLVNRYGADATAAYGAVNQIVNYVQFPALSIAITASILGAQFIGAGRADRLGALVKTGLLLNVLLTGALIVAGYLLSPWLLGFFLTSEPVRQMAEHLLHLMLWGSLVFGFQAVIAGVMRASGTVLIPVAISVGSILLVQLPAAKFLSARYGLDGVWLAYPVVFVTMLLLQSAFYRLVWRHKTIERLV